MGYNRDASRAIDEHARGGACAGTCGGPGTYVVPDRRDGHTLTSLQRGFAGADLPGILLRSTRWCEACRPKRGRKRYDPNGRTLPVAAQDAVAAAMEGRRCVACDGPADRAHIPGTASLGALAYGLTSTDRPQLLAAAVWYCSTCLAKSTGRAGQRVQSVRTPHARPATRGGVRHATIAKYGLSRQRLEEAQARCDGISELTRELFGRGAKGGSKNSTLRAYAAIVAAQHPDYVLPEFLR